MSESLISIDARRNGRAFASLTARGGGLPVGVNLVLDKPALIEAVSESVGTERAGWVYGHGTFCMVACTSRILGAFKWMRNSANEAKRMWLETGKLQGLITTVLMDSKADEKDLFRELRRQRGMLLLTTPRKGTVTNPERQRMLKVLTQKKHQHLYKQRRSTVEPMQGLVKDIFDLETCWMRGREHNRWLFAAMGVAIQMHQYRAWQEGRSTWAIKQEVLGR